MIRQVLLSLVALLLCCSYSSAYEQQYNVGDTGPNGGVITSVNVTSTLDSTKVEINAGFQETTEYWKYLETIIEKVETVETSTVLETTQTEVLTKKTTDNTVCFGCDVFGSTTGGVITNGNSAVFNYQGGTISGTVALEDYLIKSEINRGFTVNASADVMTCLQTIGSNVSCYDVGDPTADTFKITISVTDGVTNYSNVTTHTIDWNPDNFQTVYGYLNVPENNLSLSATATLELYGIDNGYWGGYYGPTVTNPTMSFTYDEAAYITQTIERQIQTTVTDYITSNLLTEQSTQEKVFIGDPVQDTVTSPVELAAPEPIKVKIEPISQDTIKATVEVKQPNGETKTETMEVKVTEMKIEKIKSLDSEASDDKEMDTARVEGDGSGSKESDASGGKSVSKGKSKGSGGNNTQVYSTVMESVRLAVMQQSDAARNFTQYQNVSLPVTPFYPPEIIDGGQVYDNPYGMWWTEAQDMIWNNMVDMQWQN